MAATLTGSSHYGGMLEGAWISASVLQGQCEDHHNCVCSPAHLLCSVVVSLLIFWPPVVCLMLLWTYMLVVLLACGLWCCAPCTLLGALSKFLASAVSTYVVAAWLYWLPIVDEDVDGMRSPSVSSKCFMRVWVCLATTTTTTMQLCVYILLCWWHVVSGRQEIELNVTPTSAASTCVAAAWLHMSPAPSAVPSFPFRSIVWCQCALSSTFSLALLCT